MVDINDKKMKLVKGKDVEHFEVKNLSGKKLGKVDDIVIDYKHGKIAYAILSVGGFLGIGDKLYAIPWKAFEINPADKSLTLDVNEEELKEAPSFEKNKWPDMDKVKWNTDIHYYYSIQPYWKYPAKMIEDDTQTNNTEVKPKRNENEI